MNYEPTIDYSQMDLSIDENLVYWKFSELIKNLITLSSDSQRQIELIGYGAVADEMAIDFETYYTLSYKSYIDFKLLTFDQKNELDEIEKYFEDRSGDKSPDFWEDFKLDTNPDWIWVRLKAKNILRLFKMDYLSIDFDRTRKFDNSGNLTMLTTKTRLVKKNPHG
jgi:hypothetical protein